MVIRPFVLLVATLIWEFNYPTPRRRIFFKMLELSSWPSKSWHLLMKKVSLPCSQTSPLNPLHTRTLHLHTLFFPRSIFILSYLHPGMPVSGWRFVPLPATNSGHLTPFHLPTLMALCNMLSSSLLRRNGTSLRRIWGIRSPNIEYSREYVRDAELNIHKEMVLRFQRYGED